MAIPRRGLQDIHTQTGKVGKATLPHEAYLRISHIEMEKARKLVESEKARQLMADIAARIQEIEAEKNHLLQEVAECQDDNKRFRTDLLQNNNSFKIKY
jgi:hypothetical protein